MESKLLFTDKFRKSIMIFFFTLVFFGGIHTTLGIIGEDEPGPEKEYTQNDYINAVNSQNTDWDKVKQSQIGDVRSERA